MKEKADGGATPAPAVFSWKVTIFTALVFPVLATVLGAVGTFLFQRFVSSATERQPPGKTVPNKESPVEKTPLQATNTKDGAEKSTREADPEAVRRPVEARQR
jgi:cytoskeletal protein RodZ